MAESTELLAACLKRMSKGKRASNAGPNGRDRPRTASDAWIRGPHGRVSWQRAWASHLHSWALEMPRERYIDSRNSRGMAAVGVASFGETPLPPKKAPYRMLSQRQNDQSLLVFVAWAHAGGVRKNKSDNINNKGNTHQLRLVFGISPSPPGAPWIRLSRQHGRINTHSTTA